MCSFSEELQKNIKSERIRNLDKYINNKHLYSDTKETESREGGRGLHEVQGKAQSLQYHQQQVELFSISSMLTYFRWLNSFKKNSSEDLIRQTTVLKIESYLIFKVIYHAVDCILQHNDQNVVEIGRSLNMRNSHHCNKCRLSIEAFKTILSIQYKYAKLKTNPSKTFLFTL